MNLILKKAISAATMAAMMIGFTGAIETDAATSTISYTKYVCGSNTGFSTYTLSTEDQASAAQARTIIGEDTRVATGHNGIVQLAYPDETQETGYSYGATGFIVGDHQIACAGHSVYFYENGVESFAQNLHIKTLNPDGTHSSLEPFEVKEIHIQTDYRASDYAEVWQMDYALLTVEEDLSEYTQFNLGVTYNYNSAQFTSIPLFVSGMVDNRVFTGAGNESSEAISTSSVIYHDCDTIYGQSGSPLYTAMKYNYGTVDSQDVIIYTALGINVAFASSYNTSVCFNSDKIHFYLNNPNIGY